MHFFNSAKVRNKLRIRKQIQKTKQTPKKIVNKPGSQTKRKFGTNPNNNKIGGIHFSELHRNFFSRQPIWLLSPRFINTIFFYKYEKMEDSTPEGVVLFDEFYSS